MLNATTSHLPKHCRQDGRPGTRPDDQTPRQQLRDSCWGLGALPGGSAFRLPGLSIDEIPPTPQIFGPESRDRNLFAQCMIPGGDHASYVTAGTLHPRGLRISGFKVLVAAVFLGGQWAWSGAEKGRFSDCCSQIPNCPCTCRLHSGFLQPAPRQQAPGKTRLWKNKSPCISRDIHCMQAAWGFPGAFTSETFSAPARPASIWPPS